MSFNINDKVQQKNDPSRVGIVENLAQQHGGQQYYRVFWGGATGTKVVAEADLALYRAVSRPSESMSAGMFAGYDDFQRVITLQRLLRGNPLRNNIYAFNASRTRFFPYQFKPLLKFLASARHRLLICDEVGLGKTIEAGLILLELRARQSTNLVLIVCPSNLREKWRLELRQRFGEDFTILDKAALLRFCEDYENAPDRQSMNGILSLETLRIESVRTRLEEVGIAFDLIVVDEAHHLRNFGTSQRQAVQELVGPAQAVVFLTATPVHLGYENLFSLLNLLDDEDFPDKESAMERFADNEYVVRAQVALAGIPPSPKRALAALQQASESPWLAARPMRAIVESQLNVLVQQQANNQGFDSERLAQVQRDLAELNLIGHLLTRTRKRDVQERQAIRRASALKVEFSESEAELYATVTSLIRRENERLTSSSVVSQWRLNMPQRRMSSSIHGMVEYYKEMLPDSAGDDPDELLSVNSLRPELSSADEDTLRTHLINLVRAWPTNGQDAKYDALSRLLRELPRTDRQQKVIIFATFKHTLRYLLRRLASDGITSVLIDGDTPSETRQAMIRRFRDEDGTRVLLSSRVGSEGLDFQFCSTLVNYDLPWNPMEVEQRIGRVDRIGQAAETIQIFNFWTTGTIEERILERLYDRIGIFERSVGGLEPILGEITSLLQEELVRASWMSQEEATQAAERAAQVIEHRLQAVEELESQAASLVGADAYFDDEVRAIRQRRRYVTGRQLFRFLEDFLKKVAPKSRLEYDFATQEGRLVPDEQLRKFLRASGKIGETLSLANAVGSGIAVTFDSQRAFEQPRFELLSVVHPLIQAVAEHYQAERNPTAAHHVRLATQLLAPGFYPFQVFRLSLTSGRPATTLEAVFIKEDLTLACDAAHAEELLGEIVEQGQAPVDLIDLDPAGAKAVLEAIERHFLARLERIREIERAGNDEFLNQRLASVRSYYGKAIEKKRRLLALGVALNRQEHYLRMIRSQAMKLDAEQDQRVEVLERLRHVNAEYEEVSAGILEVVQP